MKLISNYVRSVLIVAAMFLSAQAQAANTPPDVLVKSTTEEVLAVINKTSDRQQLLQAAELKVLPHFNFRRMTQLAVGKSWSQATPEQQQALEKEFRNLLVRTYTNALAASKKTEASVQVSPLKIEPSSAEVTVKTKVTPSGGKPIPIDYQMESSSSGWKVYDVVVENISLVTNYRETFAAEVRSSGIDGLIRSLAEKNKTLARTS